MYDKLMWLIVLCGCGVASCLTYIVCLLIHEKRQSKASSKRENSSQTLVINLDE